MMLISMCFIYARKTKLFTKLDVILVVTMQLCWSIFKDCNSLNQRKINVFPTPFDKDL